MDLNILLTWAHTTPLQSCNRIKSNRFEPQCLQTERTTRTHTRAIKNKRGKSIFLPIRDCFAGHSLNFFKMLILLTGQTLSFLYHLHFIIVTACILAALQLLPRCYYFHTFAGITVAYYFTLMQPNSIQYITEWKMLTNLLNTLIHACAGTHTVLILSSLLPKAKGCQRNRRHTWSPWAARALGQKAT